MTRPVQVVVLGGGSWGTTVAALAALNTDTLLWARDPEVADEINARHRNSATSTTARCRRRCARRATLSRPRRSPMCSSSACPRIRSARCCATPRLTCAPWVPVLSLAKGLEVETRKRPTR